MREPHWTGSASEKLGEDLVVSVVRLQMPGFAPGHDLWAADEVEGTISKIDTESNAVVATVDVGPVTHATVADGMVWARPEADLLLLIDGRTNHVDAFRLPSGEYDADVVVGFGSLWVAHFSLNEIWRVEL